MSTESKPLISIVVVSHRQINLVERLLKSLVNHHPHHNFQVFVIENARNQPPITIQQPGLPIIYQKNNQPRSFSANVNSAYKQAAIASDYFCILNPDIEFFDEVFSELITALYTHQLDIIAPLMVDHNGYVQDAFRAIPTPWEIFFRFFNAKRRKVVLDELPLVIKPDWIAGMFMLMPTRVFRQVGGFDPRYRLYFEDVDFCLKARQKGFNIGVYKAVTVIHEAQRASHRNLFFLFQHILSAVKFFSSKVYRASR